MYMLTAVVYLIVYHGFSGILITKSENKKSACEWENTIAIWEIKSDDKGQLTMQEMECIKPIPQAVMRPKVVEKDEGVKAFLEKVKMLQKDENK